MIFTKVLKWYSQQAKKKSDQVPVIRCQAPNVTRWKLYFPFSKLHFPCYPITRYQAPGHQSSIIIEPKFHFKELYFHWLPVMEWPGDQVPVIRCQAPNVTRWKLYFPFRKLYFPFSKLHFPCYPVTRYQAPGHQSSIIIEPKFHFKELYFHWLPVMEWPGDQVPVIRCQAPGDPVSKEHEHFKLTAFKNS